MSIVTKRGDDGCSDLLFGRRIAKTDPRLEAIGTVDELNAALGMVRARADAEGGGSSEAESLVQLIDTVQGQLVALMGELAVLPEDAERYTESAHPVIEESDVAGLEKIATRLEAEGLTFTGWARPGAEGNLLGAQVDVARTICRRAERGVLTLGEGLINPLGTLFLNRLSDVLWLLARKTETK